MARWQSREFDQTTAHAVALMTLYVGATEQDGETADELLDELFAGPDGAAKSLAGFQSLCGALLVLLDLETGAPPWATLQRVGAMIAVRDRHVVTWPEGSPRPRRPTSPRSTRDPFRA